MTTSNDQALRLEALDKSVRIALSKSGDESMEYTLKRAELFEKFLRDGAGEPQVVLA